MAGYPYAGLPYAGLPYAGLPHAGLAYAYTAAALPKLELPAGAISYSLGGDPFLVPAVAAKDAEQAVAVEEVAEAVEEVAELILETQKVKAFERYNTEYLSSDKPLRT